MKRKRDEICQAGAHDLLGHGTDFGPPSKSDRKTIHEFKAACMCACVS